MGFEDDRDPAQKPIEREEYERWEKLRALQLDQSSLGLAIEAANDANIAGEMESEQLEAGIKAYVIAEQERIKKENFIAPFIERTDPDSLSHLMPGWRQLIEDEKVVHPECNKFFAQNHLIVHGLIVQGFTGEDMETYAVLCTIDEIIIERRPEPEISCRNEGHCSCFENCNDDGRYICCDCFSENKTKRPLEPLTTEERETRSEQDDEPRKIRGCKNL